jgi:hypothetical protein
LTTTKRAQAKVVANVLRPGTGFSGKSNAMAALGLARQASQMNAVISCCMLCRMAPLALSP